MKKAVFTLCIGDFYRDLSAFTHPPIKEYARRIGADLIVTTDTELNPVQYAKFGIRVLLEKYDRVLYLDSDILVRPTAPDIFEVVPEDRIGLLDESPLGYHEKFDLFLSQHGPALLPAWRRHKKCYNAGVMVCSKRHRDIFQLPKALYDHYFEQSYFNMRLLQERVPVFDLPPQFNRMIYLDLVLNEHRLRSHFIHYAGFLENRPVEECLDFLRKEYQMLLSQDFSRDEVNICWAFQD